MFIYIGLSQTTLINYPSPVYLYDGLLHPRLITGSFVHVNDEDDHEKMISRRHDTLFEDDATFQPHQFGGGAAADAATLPAPAAIACGIAAAPPPYRYCCCRCPPCPCCNCCCCSN